MRECKKCGIIDERNDNDHHIIPKAIGGTDKDGRDVLCKQHHEEFHKRHYSIMMKLLIKLGFKRIAAQRTKSYYEWWLQSK